MNPITMPEDAAALHTEALVIDGVYWPANACRRCGLRFPPYGAGVPTDDAGTYCWGHQVEDAVAPYKAALTDVTRHLEALCEANHEHRYEGIDKPCARCFDAVAAARALLGGAT